MTILVTGGAGYVGSHVVKELRAVDIPCVVLDNLARGHRALVADDPLGVLRARHQAAGLALHARTTMPGWLGERLDVGWAIDVLHPRAIGPTETGP